MKVSFKRVKRLPTEEFFIPAAKIGQKCDIWKCTAMWQIFLEAAMFCDWDRAELCSTYDTRPPSSPPTQEWCELLALDCTRPCT